MALTDAELQGFAAQALNMAKRDMEQGREFNFLLASYHEGSIPPIHRMSKIEELIVNRLGEEWLNSRKAKGIGFSMLRMACSFLPPDAIVIVTAANAFRNTAKLDALPEAQQREFLNAGHNRHHEMVKEGLLEILDSIIVVAQSPTRVCQYVQEVHRDQLVGEPEVTFRSQEDFGGRLKMF